MSEAEGVVLAKIYALVGEIRQKPGELPVVEIGSTWSCTDASVRAVVSECVEGIARDVAGKVQFVGEDGVSYVMSEDATGEQVEALLDTLIDRSCGHLLALSVYFLPECVL